MIEHTQNGIRYLSFKSFDDLGFNINIFTTRIGGVSQGYHSSMNLGFGNGDREEDVRENFNHMAAVIGISPDHIVRSKQTHTVNLKRVTSAEVYYDGKLHQPDYTDIDGLLTDTPGIALSTSFADCVPLYFADPVHKAIALSHSGWRGTVQRMGKVTIEAMSREFGSRPSEIYAAIGPSICVNCYEVSTDVAEKFQAEFPDEKEIVVPNGKPGKYQLDLWKANKLILMESGIPEDHIETAGICTCENSDWLFSHRASHGKRGNLAAFLMIKENKAQA